MLRFLPIRFRERPFIFWFPMLLKKIFWFWWRKKKIIWFRVLPYNLMLNSGKKIRVLPDKKNKYSNSRVVQKKILIETKNHNPPPPPPPFKLNGRSLNIFNCWTAFLQTFLIWQSKFNMKSKSTPKSLTISSHDIFAVPIWKMGDLSKDFLLTAIAWNFSGFAYMQLKWNQFMSILLSCCKTFTTSSKFGEWKERVLSSA